MKCYLKSTEASLEYFFRTIFTQGQDVSACSSFALVQNFLFKCSKPIYRVWVNRYPTLDVSLYTVAVYGGGWAGYREVDDLMRPYV